MVYRYAAVALLAGLGCYRAPRIPSAAVTELGCVYDPVTEQLRVCLEPGMVGVCPTFGPRCAGGRMTAERDLDIPVYKTSPHYLPVEPAVQPAPAEVLLAPPVESGEVGYVGYVGGETVTVGGGGGGGLAPPPTPTAPPSRPPPPRGRPPVTGGFSVPPRGIHPLPPRGHHPVPPPGIVVTPQAPLGVPPTGRPDVASGDPGPGPIILRHPQGTRVVPQAQTQQAPPKQPPRRPLPRKR